MNRADRLPGLNLLRSIAIVWVMLFHSSLLGGLGQHWNRVSGPKTGGLAITSSSVNVWRNTASGLRAGCRRTSTEMRPKVSARMPYCAM